MCRKSMLFSIYFLITASVVGAAEIKWKGGGRDNCWHTAGNWDGGKVPGPGDIIVLNPPPARGPVIDQSVQCGGIRGPVWKSDSNQVMEIITSGTVKISGQWRFANRGDGVATINIRDGSITVDGQWRWSDSGGTYGIVNVTGGAVRCKGILIGDGGGGEINVSGNGLIEVEQTLNLGGSRGDMPLAIKMNGGMIRVGGELRCPSNADRAGKTTVNLNAGSIHCAKFSHADVAYSMNIEEGTLTINGDVTTDIRKDISEGYITAYGGKAKVLCTYDPASKKTIVMSSLHKKAWNPEPANRAEQILPNIILKWNPADNAETHNIYFGTSLDAVCSGATAYLKNQKTTWFKAALEFGKTYYWRVDTVDKSGGIARGTIWQFTTTDGKTANPSPQNNATGVPVDVTLSWKPGLAAARHKVYLGTDYELVRNATKPRALGVKGKKSGNSFRPDKLQLGQTYYWRVDAVNKKWSESPWKGDIWSFTVDEGKADSPYPVNKGQWTPTKVTLNWEPAKTATSHNVYFGDNPKAMRLVSSGQSKHTYAVGPLKKASTYYWRVDEICSGKVLGPKVVKGDVWQFSTEGMLDLKVDLAVPQWYDRSKARPRTAKPGWVIWAAERWADMYMHNPVWFPSDDNDITPDKDGILGTGIHALLCNGGGGNGTVHAKGLCRGGLGGDLPPYGEPEGDPIANTYFYACDWAGQKQGDIFLLLEGLPAGTYELTSYHNHWEPCTQQTRNCHNCKSGMPPMPSVTANPLPTKPLPGYMHGWPLPKGTGKGVVALENARNIRVSSVLHDDEVTRSKIVFATDGSAVLIIYEAADNTYPDRARKGREGARGILNAFELKKVVKK